MKRLAAMLLICMVLMGGTAMGAFYEESWYPEALKASEMRIGNNMRLKKVIERARAGEQITIGTMGGSVTEGAGASAYPECWACRFAKRFGVVYGTDQGSNVTLVNAGVGGTPSTFGYMRFQRDIVERVPETDPDGYPDLVIIEYALNDWGEPTNHRCFESMVKDVLSQPNEPAVILLFAMRNDGWNLQGDLRQIGDRYDLMMVSVADGIYPHIDKEISKKEFFFDEYHPNSTGHRIMADCLIRAVADAAERETDAQDIDLSVKSVYGTDFRGLETIYGDREVKGITVDRGGFTGMDSDAYKNRPVGLVCGKNFFHDAGSPDDPLKVKGVFSKCLIAWKASPDASFGEAEVLVDGESVMKLKGGKGKWNQSEVALALDSREPKLHTVEIRVTDADKKFTITAISVR